MRDINLIPREYLNRKNRNVRLLFGILMIAGVILGMLYYYTMQQNIIKELEQEIKSYDDMVIEYNILKGKLEQLEMNEEKIRERLQVIEKISSQEVKPTTVIEVIKKAMPQDVLLTDINYTSTVVNLSCVAESVLGASEFYVELGKYDQFYDFTLSPVTKINKVYKFTIQFFIDAGSDKNEED